MWPFHTKNANGQQQNAQKHLYFYHHQEIQILSICELEMLPALHHFLIDEWGYEDKFSSFFSLRPLLWIVSVTAAEVGQESKGDL